MLKNLRYGSHTRNGTPHSIVATSSKQQTKVMPRVLAYRQPCPVSISLWTFRRTQYGMVRRATVGSTNLLDARLALHRNAHPFVRDERGYSALALAFAQSIAVPTSLWVF